MGSRRQAKATIWTQAAVLCLQYGTELVQSTGWAMAAARSSLVLHAVPLMPLGLRNASSWFNSIGKKPSVKADLTIYGQVLGASG